MNKGKLWGVGVGPGDPQLMTLKAVSVIRSCGAVAVPRKNKGDCLSLQIAAGAIPEVMDKPMIEVDMPMTKDPEKLERGFREGTAALREALDNGISVAFLTLGDPSVYSTYSYLHTRIVDLGYETEVVPGIPSFCAVAAAINEPLCQGREELHIIPATFGVKNALEYPGVKVLMKHAPGETRLQLMEKPLRVTTVENCGLPDQHIYHTAEEIPENGGYYTLSVVKEEKR